VNHSQRRWRIIFLFGVLGVTLGVGLVVQGEVQRARDDERFRKTQEALKAGVDVFSDGGAVADDLTQDPNLGQEPPAAEESPTSEGDASLDVATQSEGAVLRSIGRLQIPKIGLDAATLRYGKYADLEIGLGWMPQSAALGADGAAIVVGHRTLFGAPLRRADELKPGDPIYLQLPDGTTVTYEVKLTSIRKPTETFGDVLSEGGTSRLVIVTCHPEDSTDFRLLVVADVVERV
jgi:LPXTG-site transpeptidase (sortase) family protein